MMQPDCAGQRLTKYAALTSTVSFRDAPTGAGPESTTTIGSMDSGLVLRTPRNDGSRYIFAVIARLDRAMQYPRGARA